MIGDLLIGLMTCAGVAFGLVGWAGAMAGPRGLLSFGIFGFLLAAAANVATFARPATLPRPRQGMLYRWLGVATTVGLSLAALSFVTLFATAGTNGVADLPAWEPRASYELVNHGRRTPVSRSTYVVAGAALGTGWHAMVLAANLAALRRRLYGSES